MRKKYTEKQIRKLKKNPCVFDCKSHLINYTYEFKIRAIDLYNQGIHPEEIWKRAELDIQIWRKNYCRDTIKDWRRLVEKGGLQKLTNEGGIQSDKGTKEQKTHIKRLEARVKYLEAENDFLAKIRAKRAELNSGLMRNTRSLKD